MHHDSTTTPEFFKGSLAELRAAYSAQQAPVVEGLFRQGETCNIIADPKVGKSWLAYNLALCVISGSSWLERFPTSAGRVLLIDNELHATSIASRIPKVANAMGLATAGVDFQSDLDVWSLRGHLHSLIELGEHFDAIAHGAYQLVILDAKYRFAAAGSSENDNAAEALFYNRVDVIAERTGAAIAMVHHASKGDQSGKRTTDVGAGAGAQSRAADCHLILREHERPAHVVLDAAVRSFGPVESMVLRWDFPLWHPAKGIDPAQLKGAKKKGDQRIAARDREGIELIAGALADGSRATRSKLRTDTGMSPDRLNKLVTKMLKVGSLERGTVTVRGNKTDEFWLST